MKYYSDKTGQMYETLEELRGSEKVYDEYLDSKKQEEANKKQYELVVALKKVSDELREVWDRLRELIPDTDSILNYESDFDCEECSLKKECDAEESEDENSVKEADDETVKNFFDELETAIKDIIKETTKD